MMKNFPDLVLEKIGSYEWRNKIKCVNKQYFKEILVIKKLGEYICRKKRVSRYGFESNIWYNTRTLEYNEALHNYNPFMCGYYYEKMNYFRSSIGIYNNKHRQYVMLPPRYLYSMDPPDDIMKKYETKSYQ
tara:strand:- start:1145 stop:1537 length:393 start_codon:yes stop_codon:yes gene_type:complete